MRDGSNGVSSSCLGVMAFGPPGTGKTETIKEIARTAGLRCVALSCSKGLFFNTI